MSTIECCDSMNVYFFSNSLFVRLHRIAPEYEPLFLLFSLSFCPCEVHDADKKMCGWEYYIKNILKPSI